MGVTIKLLCICVAMSVYSKFTDNVYIRNKIYVYTCFNLLMSVLLFNSEYLIIYLILSILLGYGYVLIIKKRLGLCGSLREEQLQAEVSKYMSLAGVYITKCEELEAHIAELTKPSQELANTSYILIDYLYQRGLSGDIDEEYMKQFEKLRTTLQKPIVRYANKDFSMFDSLHTNKERKRALKFFRTLKKKSYLGEGFDNELSVYIKLLEEAIKLDNN